jgi:hypothetical protein
MTDLPETVDAVQAKPGKRGPDKKATPMHGTMTMTTWIKCTDERGQIIYVNIANAITLIRNEAQHRGTVITFMGASDPVSVRETPEDILNAAKSQNSN